MSNNATMTPEPVFKVQAVKPSDALKSLVHCYYWTQISKNQKSSSPTVARVLPHAAADILVADGDAVEINRRGNITTLAGAGSPGALCGPFLTTPSYRCEGKTSIFGIRLRHGALGRVLPIPAKQLVNTLMPLTAIWQNQNVEALLTDPISKAGTFEAKCAAAEKGLSELFKGIRSLDEKLNKAIASILETKGKIGVTELAGVVGVSRQTLKSKFDQGVGFAPKLFGRLQRFQNTLKTLYRSGRSSWTDLAQECGYYDQAHLIREFNHFTGFSPERLLKDISRGDSIYYFDQAQQTLALVKGDQE